MCQLPQRSVRSLCLVSSTLYAALFPRLHRAITFCASNEWPLNVLDVGHFLQDHPDPRAREIMQDVRRLTVKAPVHLARSHRCVYNNNFFPPIMSPRGLRWGARTNRPLTVRFWTACCPRYVRSSLGQHPASSIRFSMYGKHFLRPPKLTSSRWHIGTCIPPGILDAKGYFVRLQQQIRRLSLITGTCLHAGITWRVSRVSRHSPSWSGKASIIRPRSALCGTVSGRTTVV